jgi:cell division protein FtsL
LDLIIGQLTLFLFLVTVEFGMILVGMQHQTECLVSSRNVIVRGRVWKFQHIKGVQVVPFIVGL